MKKWKKNFSPIEIREKSHNQKSAPNTNNVVVFFFWLIWRDDSLGASKTRIAK